MTESRGPIGPRVEMQHVNEGRNEMQQRLYFGPEIISNKKKKHFKIPLRTHRESKTNPIETLTKE